jgi:beta-glucanase (GH16 family)
MKYTTIILTLLLSTTDIFADPPTPLIGHMWDPVLVDHFDGDELDTAIWTKEEQTRNGGNNGVDWYWRPDNISVTNGNLVIQTVQDAGVTNSYSSGCVESGDKWSSLYGYWEASVELPPVDHGIQAAIWAMPNEGGTGTVGNGGRDGAEIDIMESPHIGDKYYGAFHWDGYGDDHQSVSSGAINVPGLRTGYHTFAMQWNADEVQFYCDDAPTWLYTGEAVPRVAERALLSVGIIDWCDGDIRTAPLPLEARFDWFKAWTLRTNENVVVVDNLETNTLSYSGYWATQYESGYYEGSMAKSGSTSAAVELTFAGTGIDVFTHTGPWGGYADVYLDGELIEDNLDTYNSTQNPQQRILTLRNLDPSAHTLMLKPGGNSGHSANSYLLMFDAIQFIPYPDLQIWDNAAATDAYWTNAANWNAAEPAATNAALIAGGAWNVVLDAPRSADKLTVGQNVTIAIGGTLSTTALEINRGTVTIDGGSITNYDVNPTSDTIGLRVSLKEGTLNLNSGRLDAADWIRVDGTINQSGGTLTAPGDIFIPHGVSATGTVTVSGGLMSADIIHVGENGTGLLTVEGGTVETTTTLSIGDNQAGTVMVNGGLLHSLQDTIIGNGPYAAGSQLIVREGILDTDRYLSVRRGGVFVIDGGAAITRTVVIAKTGSGTVNLLSGSLEIEGNWKSACSIYEDGEMHIEGGILIWNGDRRADFNELVASHKISWANGGAMRFDSWDHSYTNGTTVLYSYRSAETANKTVVWSTSIPTLLYNDWADSYSLSGPSAEWTANPDNDDLDNLLEYALGGVPTTANDADKLPTFLPAGALAEEGGMLEYIYRRRRDDDTRGLSYEMVRQNDLAAENWTTNGIIETGATPLDPDFESVTNHISTETEAKQFLKLRIGIE